MAIANLSEMYRHVQGASCQAGEVLSSNLCNSLLIGTVSLGLDEHSKSLGKLDPRGDSLAEPPSARYPTRRTSGNVNFLFHKSSELGMLPTTGGIAVSGSDRVEWMILWDCLRDSSRGASHEDQA